MAQTIKLRRSATASAVPTTTQLALGELAINTYDGKLFLKKNVSGVESIVELGAAGASGTSVTVSATAPSSPSAGALWWDSTNGVLRIYYSDGTSSQWVDAFTSGSGGSGTSNAAAFYAYNSTGQNVSSNTSTKLVFDTERYDVTSCYDTSTSRFTATVAGYYQFTTCATRGNAGAPYGTNFLIAFYKNGAEHVRGNQVTGGIYALQATGLIYLNGTTDYVEVYIFQAAENPATIGSATSEATVYFSGVMVRSA